MGRPRRSLVSELARWWDEAPAVATIPALRVSSGVSFVVASTLGLYAVTTLPYFAGHRLQALAVVVTALLTGVLILGCGGRLPRWSYNVAGAFAVLCITVLGLLTPPGPQAALLASPYMFVVIDIAFLMSLRVVLVELALVLTGSAITLGRAEAHPAEMLLVQGTLMFGAASVAWLARMANRVEEDPLTGLLNRRGFERRLEAEVERMARAGGHLVVAVLDLDRFKQVNESSGHDGGDRVLVATAQAWAARVPDGAVLSRFGGDEFALLLSRVPPGLAADHVDFLRAFAPRGMTVSAGVAAWELGDTGAALFRKADVALFDAKASGRDQTVVSGDPSRSASELELAVENRELRIHLQPLVRLSTREVVGYESLVRWQHPRKGLLAPMEFVPQAERTGAIHTLGAWVLEESCRVYASAPGRIQRIGVNVTLAQLRSERFLELVATVIERHGIPRGALVFEVTESMVDDDGVVAVLGSLRAMGVLIALDDFGSGYSSLRRVAAMPVDMLKLDGTLIGLIDADRDDAPILEAIASLARVIGVEIIAEHVETEHQADVLRQLGFDLVQGFLYGEPMPPATAIETCLPGGAASFVAAVAPPRLDLLTARLTERASLRRPVGR